MKIVPIVKNIEEDFGNGIIEKYTETRYIIIDDDGVIVDDTQGYGYKSVVSAKKALWYKSGGKEKILKEKNEALLFWTEHKDINNFVKNIYEMMDKEDTDDSIIKSIVEKFNTKIKKQYLKYIIK